MWPLPDDFLGYHLSRSASLTKDHQDQVLQQTKNQMNLSLVVDALRHLDRPVLRGGGVVRSAFFGEAATEAEAEAEEQDEDDVMSSVYSGEVEFDEDRVYTEMEANQMIQAAQVYAQTWRKVRQDLNQHRNDRGFFKPSSDRKRGDDRKKGDDSKKGLGKGSGKHRNGRPRQRREDLEKRVRCWRCQKVGHMSKDCREPPAQSSQSATGSSSQSTAGSRASGGGPANAKQFFVVGSAKPAPRYFLQVTAWVEAATSSPAFHGLALRVGHGLVDTGAEDGVCGQTAFDR